MPRRQLVPSTKHQVDKYLQQCSETIPGFSDCWNEFHDMLIYHAECGERHATGKGEYYLLAREYNLPNSNAGISIGAIYIMNSEKVVITRLRVKLLS